LRAALSWLSAGSQGPPPFDFSLDDGTLHLFTRHSGPKPKRRPYRAAGCARDALFEILSAV